MSRAWRKTAALCLLLVLGDAFVLNQGIISLLVGVWLVLVSIPVALLSKRWKAMRLARLGHVAMGMAAVLLVLAINAANNQLARSRAEMVIAAINAFHAAQSRYPDALQALVPAYLPSVPHAKYTLLSNDFRYLHSGDGALLMYAALPPFGRPVYNFKTQRWGYVD
jgi:hypothetical protein